MRSRDRLARLEARLLPSPQQGPSIGRAKEEAMTRLMEALRAALTVNGAYYESAIARLSERMNGHAMTAADAAALSGLRTDDLATMGMTPANLVNLLHDLHCQY
jgi:hypothetical protein